MPKNTACQTISPQQTHPLFITGGSVKTSPLLFMTSVPRPTSFFLQAVTACILVLFLSGCIPENVKFAKNDLAMAEDALNARDTGDAEMHLTRYLRKNPEGEDRWVVWRKLLGIVLNVRQDKNTAKDYLEIMLIEFAGDTEKRHAIQYDLAALCNEMRDYTRAVHLWEKLAAAPDTPDIKKAAIYRELSRAYLRRLELTRATDVLELCLTLQVPLSVKADCLYDAAQARMYNQEMDAAEKSLLEILEIQEVSEERKVLTIFALAELREHQDKLQEAQELFSSIRETYPNEKVIELRIARLKKKATTAPPMVTPRR